MLWTSGYINRGTLSNLWQAKQAKRKTHTYRVIPEDPIVMRQALSDGQNLAPAGGTLFIQHVAGIHELIPMPGYIVPFVGSDELHEPLERPLWVSPGAIGARHHSKPVTPQHFQTPLPPLFHIPINMTITTRTTTIKTTTFPSSSTTTAENALSSQFISSREHQLRKINRQKQT